MYVMMHVRLVASWRRICKMGIVRIFILTFILLTQLTVVAKYSISYYGSSPKSRSVSTVRLQHSDSSSSDADAAAAAAVQLLIRLSSSTAVNDSEVPVDSLLVVQSYARRDDVYERASREGLEYDESEYLAHQEETRNKTAKTERPIARIVRDGIVYRMNSDGEIVVYDEVDRRSAADTDGDEQSDNVTFGDTELLEKRLFSNYKGEMEDQNFVAE